MGHDFAAGGGEFGFGAHADDFGVIGIGDDQAGFIWQQFCRKLLIHGPEVPVAPFQIALPFMIGLKIGTAGFAFDNPNLALRAKSHDIDAQPAGRDQFFDRDEIMVSQMAANTASQKLAGFHLGLRRIGHCQNVNKL